MDVRTECVPFAPRAEKWTAIDASTYDCDCDQDGYFSRDPIGYGSTREAAIRDLLEQLEVA
jgi:hypothetical protein